MPKTISQKPKSSKTLQSWFTKYLTKSQVYLQQNTFSTTYFKSLNPTLVSTEQASNEHLLHHQKAPVTLKYNKYRNWWWYLKDKKFNLNEWAHSARTWKPCLAINRPNFMLLIVPAILLIREHSITSVHLLPIHGFHIFTVKLNLFHFLKWRKVICYNLTNWYKGNENIQQKFEIRCDTLRY